MKHLNILIVLFLFGLFVHGIALANKPDNTLIKYYSAYLSLNLNHALGSSKVIYHLSHEQAIDKNFIEGELVKIEQDINYANNNIANIIINTTNSNKNATEKFLKSIDEHLSRVSLDLNSVADKMNRQEKFSSLISDIYTQINKAENEDHREIKRILKLKELDEPLLVEPID